VLLFISITQGSYGHGKPGEVMEFKNGYFPDLENPKSFGKVMEISYIHMFIYAV